MHRSIPALIAATAGLALLATPLRAQQDVTVDASTIVSLDTKLRAFARSLPAGEQRVLAGMLRGAAGAPEDNPMAVALAGRFVERGADGIIVQGGRAASGIVVQGGRTADGIIVEGGRAPSRPGAEAIGPKQDDPRTPAGRTGAVAIGPKQDDPRTPAGRTGAVAIGPKQDDPRTPAGRTGAVAIGPKQDDPRAPVIARLSALATRLTVAEAATLDWVVARALSRPDVGGIPPEEGPSVAEALGVVALGAGGPGRGVPTPPPAGFRATLRM